MFDLEFNQDPDSILDLSLLPDPSVRSSKYPFEIIQFGAVKLDEAFHTVDTFSRLVKPSIYSKVSPFIMELTSITSESLQSEAAFESVYKDFADFTGACETVFIVWGMTDIKELFRNIAYHNLDDNLLTRRYLNIQPHTSVHLGMSKKKLLRLSYCVKALGIAVTDPFHDALNDAFYTAEIFKKVYHPGLQPRRYDPSRSIKAVRPGKRVLDFPVLIAQFEKMYSREMTPEEREIIRLAYHMGKTGQFLKGKV